MNIAFWITAGLLALFYCYAGALKITRNRDQLRPMMTWVDRVPLPAVRIVGALEVLGALGLILPPLIGLMPWLVVAAAIGFVLLQLGAIPVHLTGGDRRVTLNITLLLTAAVTVWFATTWV
ncbi:DoxX family protein [Nocardia sp. NPDC052112]|uniref:DoxX family protein n=1 Tax=Nocardia sp. NPDC052112 TaxID=3155646 RepID=UPI00342A2E12